MRSVLRFGLVLAFVVGVGADMAIEPLMAAQETQAAAPVDPALKARVERRFRVLPVRHGIVLTPRRRSRALQSIEIRDGAIAVDGSHDRRAAARATRPRR